MMRRNPIFIHPQPWPDQQHRRSRRAEHVREQPPREQNRNVLWSRFAFHRHVYPARKRRTTTR